MNKKNNVLSILLLIFIFVLLSNKASAFSVLNPPYNQTDSNFNKLAIKAYNSGMPHFYTYGSYTYNAIPVFTTSSGCKIVSVIRETSGFSNPKFWNVENYKICSGNITEVKNTNMAGWNNLPVGLKPVINNAVEEAKQYGQATADYYSYKVIAKTGVYEKTVFVYILNGIKLEAMIKF